MNNKTKKPYRIALCIAIPLFAFLIFTAWYYQPRHYDATIVFELKEIPTLEIPADALPISNLLTLEENTVSAADHSATETASSKPENTKTMDANFSLTASKNAIPENTKTLDISFELTAQKSFFRPEEFYGKLSINGREYTSTFFVENSEEEPWTYPFPKTMSSILKPTAIYFPHDTGNWFQNLKAKLQGEQWVPFFVSEGYENTKNAVIVQNLQELFEKPTPQECDLCIQIGEKSYTIKNTVTN